MSARELLPRGSDGRLDAYTSQGCYPLAYLTNRDDVLCADCATVAEDEEDTRNQPKHAFVHWEGVALTCDECSTEIKSAYGDPDEEVTEDSE